MILAGDVGGTNTRLALFEGKNRMAFRRYPSKEYASLSDIVRRFLEEEDKRVDCACFALAGPVHQGTCKLTNLKWTVDAREMFSELKIGQVFLLNDLEASAWGIRCLEEKDLFTLHEGVKQKGNAGLIAAGTGLGEAGLYWDGKRHRPFACEGSHADFGPRTEIEVELLSYLLKKYPGHVSWERAVSGMGFSDLFQFLIDSGHEKASPAVIEEMRNKDLAAVITEWGESGRDRVCKRVLEMFLSMYGAEAGNMALKYMALGGMYVGGGIAPKILNSLKNGLFLEGFLNKGRFRPLLETIRIRVILNADTALLGSAEYIRNQSG